MKKCCISKSTKARKEFFAPNDSEARVAYVLVMHLLALSPLEKRLLWKNDIFMHNPLLTKSFCPK